MTMQAATELKPAAIFAMAADATTGQAANDRAAAAQDLQDANAELLNGDNIMSVEQTEAANKDLEADRNVSETAVTGTIQSTVIGSTPVAGIQGIDLSGAVSVDGGLSAGAVVLEVGLDLFTTEKQKRREKRIAQGLPPEEDGDEDSGSAKGKTTSSDKLGFTPMKESERKNTATLKKSQTISAPTRKDPAKKKEALGFNFEIGGAQRKRDEINAQRRQAAEQLRLKREAAMKIAQKQQAANKALEAQRKLHEISPYSILTPTTPSLYNKKRKDDDK